MHLDKKDKYLVLVEGPAGLRIVKKYDIDEKGVYRLYDNVITLADRDLYSEEDLKKIILIEKVKFIINILLLFLLE